jgi:hypothetical protein
MGMILIAGLCFGGSFLRTVAMRSQDVVTSAAAAKSPIAERLDLDPQQVKVIEAHDLSFVNDLSTLRKDLEMARSRLAASFENENATDDEIHQRVEAAIDAHNRLERRVAEYLIAVRDHLTPKQQRQLYGLCAEKVRECGKRWRRGWARHDDTFRGGHGRGKGPGRGRGQGRGQGRGHGHGQGQNHGTGDGEKSQQGG